MSTDNPSHVPTQPFTVPVDEEGRAAQVLPAIEVDGGSEAAQPVESDGAALPKLPPITTGEVNSIAGRTASLGEMLIDAGLSIAVAESLTGGAVAAELTRVPGISHSLIGAIVAYQFETKTKLLGVENDLLAANGAVHPEVALQMAQGVRVACSTPERGVDIGIATTGVAGPEPADGHAVGTVFVAISSLWGDRVSPLDFRNLVRQDDPVGSRQRIRQATVEAAVFNVLDFLIEHADGTA